jgi:hypothetical protein
MKIRFPYRLASEFYLFHPPAKKLTLIHLLILVIPVGTSTFVFLYLRDTINVWVAAIGCAIAFFTLAPLLNRLACSFLPLLMKAVDRGIIQQPDFEKWEKQVRRSAGWRD